MGYAPGKALLMKYHLTLCASLVIMCTAPPPALAADAIGFSAIHAPPAAGSWAERLALFKDADLIEITVRVNGNRSPAQIVELTRTPLATVGCVITPQAGCSSLRPLGLEDIPVDLLLDLLVAQVPSPSASPGPPASLPVVLSPPASRAAADVSFSDWSFNPEAGMWMPGQITIDQSGRVLHIEVERFLLLRG